MDLSAYQAAAGNIDKLHRRYPGGFSEVDSVRRVDVAQEDRP